MHDSQKFARAAVLVDLDPPCRIFDTPATLVAIETWNFLFVGVEVLLFDVPLVVVNVCVVGGRLQKCRWSVS